MEYRKSIKLWVLILLSQSILVTVSRFLYIIFSYFAQSIGPCPLCPCPDFCWMTGHCLTGHGVAGYTRLCDEISIPHDMTSEGPCSMLQFGQCLGAMLALVSCCPQSVCLGTSVRRKPVQTSPLSRLVLSRDWFLETSGFPKRNYHRSSDSFLPTSLY